MNESFRLIHAFGSETLAQIIVEKLKLCVGLNSPHPRIYVSKNATGSYSIESAREHYTPHLPRDSTNT